MSNHGGIANRPVIYTPKGLSQLMAGSLQRGAQTPEGERDLEGLLRQIARESATDNEDGRRRTCDGVLCFEQISSKKRSV